MRDCTGDEETQSREKQGCQWEDLCRFQHFGQDLIMPLNFYDNIFKRLDIGTQPEFQSHNTFGEQVVREQNSQQVLMLLSER